jgi:hypothetical protein
MIPEPLHLGRPEPSVTGTSIRFDILDEDERKVGLLIDSKFEGDYALTIYGSMLRMRSFSQDELLEACGLWLAYQATKVS